MEDLVRYLDEIVEPTVRDFEANPTSLRHAFLACVVVFHAVDYRAYPRKARPTREKYRRASQDFALVDQVAHAFKHVVTGLQGAPNHLKAGDVISRPPTYWGSAAWDLSCWNDPIGGVTLDGDRSVDVLATVKRGFEFLRRETKLTPKAKRRIAKLA
jgi:hypothetical protein